MDAMAFIWMFVVLKIPIAALLWLVWWALKEPEPTVGNEDGGEGGSRRPDRPRRPRGPLAPRRGPHGTPPPAPPRVRTGAVARDRAQPTG